MIIPIRRGVNLRLGEFTSSNNVEWVHKNLSSSGKEFLLTNFQGSGKALKDENDDVLNLKAGKDLHPNYSTRNLKSPKLEIAPVQTVFHISKIPCMGGLKI